MLYNDLFSQDCTNLDHFLGESSLNNVRISEGFDELKRVDYVHEVAQTNKVL